MSLDVSTCNHPDHVQMPPVSDDCCMGGGDGEFGQGSVTAQDAEVRNMIRLLLEMCNRMGGDNGQGNCNTNHAPQQGGQAPHGTHGNHQGHGGGNGHGVHGNHHGHGGGNGHDHGHGVDGDQAHDHTGAGEYPEIDGPQGETETIHDTRGSTAHTVTGRGNTYTFVGDHGENTFRISGFENRVSIQNIGADEHVILEGPPEDWSIVDDGGDGSDGTVTYYNEKTGTSVTLSTDDGRDDEFVNSRVQFSGGYPHEMPGDIDDNCGCPPPPHDCDDTSESTWEVDQENKEIKLDNGYTLKFSNDRQEWVLTDADGKELKVWGDPHVVEGDGDLWDFQHDSTFVLEDGTKITVGTKDIGNAFTVTDTVTITKGDQAIEVTGVAENNVQISDVQTNGEQLDADTNDGYIFLEGEAGGQGGVDDWHTEDGVEIKTNQALDGDLENEFDETTLPGYDGTSHGGGGHHGHDHGHNHGNGAGTGSTDAWVQLLTWMINSNTATHDYNEPDHYHHDHEHAHPA